MSLMNRVKFESNKWEEMDFCSCGDEAFIKINNEWICDFCYWFYHERLKEEKMIRKKLCLKCNKQITDDPNIPLCNDCKDKINKFKTRRKNKPGGDLIDRKIK